MLKAGRLPALVATSSLELGIDMGAIDLVIQIEAPPSVAQPGCSASGAPDTRSASRRRGMIFPKYRGDLLEAAVVVRADARRGHRGDRASRATRSTCWPSSSWPSAPERSWSVDELHALVDAARTFARPVARAAGGRAGHALRPLPVRRVRRAAAARRLGSRRRHRHEPQRRARGGCHHRRHHPRPRPVRRLPGRRGERQGAGASASWTRRWSTSRASARSSCWRQLLADRGDQATTACSFRPRPGSRARCRSGRASDRPADRAGTRDRRLPARVCEPIEAEAATAERLRDDARAGRAGGAQPAGLPGRAARGDGRPADRSRRSWSSASATSWATGGSAC